ncbi:hypothetical protein [Ralstonia sp. ASV6]|uniref:hypothetical protein n=1 Tax=Ralstonia sp. ASV6 TaxID=2795124 RepID=UPI0018EAE694|nr:hypothetical protein [Ralstonia sp. ASV6]
MNTPTVESLAESIKSWWEDHKSDTASDGSGDWVNVFNDEPEFVTQAKLVLGDWEQEKREREDLARRLWNVAYALEKKGDQGEDWSSARALEERLLAGQHAAADIDNAKQLLLRYGK